MQSYKVQFTKTYIIDVQAHDQEEAKIKAEIELHLAESTFTAHYYNTGDTDVVVFDVTGSDDDFIINE